MLSYFLSPEFTISDKLVQVLYLLSGFFCMYSGIRSWTKKDSENPFATGFFWFTLGIIVAFGMWLTDFQVGVLVCLICIPAALNRVKRNTLQTPSQEEQRANFNKIGMKIFIPALSSAVFALGIAIFLKGWNSLIGSLLATIFGITLLLIWNKENKIMTFMEEGRRFLGMASAIFIMPLLLSCLGAVFTRAGVGEVFASVFSKIIPEGNIYVGILAYTIGMVLFTIIMGNAFAAITVMTVGVGVPFVMNLGADPLYMISLALTTGYCGTLVTPMAANFNIVPGIYLETENKYSIIKMQIVPAILMFIFQVSYMCIVAK